MMMFSLIFVLFLLGIFCLSIIFARRIFPWQYQWLGLPLGILLLIILLFSFIFLVSRYDNRPMHWEIVERTNLVTGPAGYDVVVDNGWYTYWQADSMKKELNSKTWYNIEIVSGVRLVTYKFSYRSVSPQLRWLDIKQEKRVIIVPPGSKIREEQPPLPIPAEDLR